MSSAYSTIRVEVENHVATLTLNRPESRNALNTAMCGELIAATEALAADEAVHVVVIRGEGPVFCAGADLKERKDMSTAELTARRVKGFTAYAALERLPQAVIAVVHGAAFGSGCEIAGASDFILASTEAKFRYPEVGWGTIGATQRLPRMVGTRMAKELLFTGRTVEAQEAKAIGLVNHVYEPAELEARAMEMARHIAAAAPLTVRLTKRCVDQGVETTREGAMAVELLAIEENLRHSDWKRAISGFGAGAQKNA
ncbi:enoyl-CoA hydratase/isomerase family protein [Pigmentiphaga sp. H8]|uniref:enoyl-CoA hydratase/isomerase family protein n=1 Tax=unclassified Pigmentiphaga TaxID=2626614 RepID=UPI000F597316|nr:enoyl-CoA hydratase/isomerase family protein [Pigmentiphaga sp. H8]AZG07887.1 enoyl-CoA hydratase/isomerase family protein [Pigmentiphaga sp. H8]